MENRWLKVGFRQISGKWYLYLWGNFSYQSKYHYTYIQGDIDVFIGLKYVKQIKVSNVIPNIDNKNHELLATWQRVCIPEDNQEVMQGSLAWRGSAGCCAIPIPTSLSSNIGLSIKMCLFANLGMYMLIFIDLSVYKCLFKSQSRYQIEVMNLLSTSLVRFYSIS